MSYKHQNLWFLLFHWLSSHFRHLGPKNSNNFIHTVFENHSIMSQLNFSILALSTNLCLIKIDLSVVWKHCLAVSFRFSKTRQNGPFLAFLNKVFFHSKCNRSSLRSHSWVRHFLWFSNTVPRLVRLFSQSNASYFSHEFMNNVMWPLLINSCWHDSPEIFAQVCYYP